MRIPIYITNRNLMAVRGMVAYLATVPGADPVIIDCASTYPPLLDWYARECPVPVKRLRDNRGSRAGWYFVDPRAPYFVISDGDFDLTGVPTDCLEVLRVGLDRYPNHLKAGLCQRFDDLPESPIKGAAVAQEMRYRQVKLDALFWEGEIDGSFALHRQSCAPYWRGAGGPLGHFGPALLADGPYAMRHLSWYVTPETLTPDYRYSLERVAADTIVWSGIVRDWLGIPPVDEPNPHPRPWEPGYVESESIMPGRLSSHGDAANSVRTQWQRYSVRSC